MTAPKLEDWSPEQVKAALDKREIVLIDVRTPQEYLLERIEGALLAPMSSFEETSLPTQTDKRIVLHCGSGVRSRKVGDACLAAGATRMAHMEGGFRAWKEKKLPYLGIDMVTGAPKRMTS